MGKHTEERPRSQVGQANGEEPKRRVYGSPIKHGGAMKPSGDIVDL